MANPSPVIVICVAALAASLGAAVLASASPNEDRPCAAGELVAERFFAIETPETEGGRRAAYFAELANPQSRPQVFNLAFDLPDAQERRTGARAASIPGQQTMPIMLGQQRLEDDAAPLSPQAIAEAVRMTCRSW